MRLSLALAAAILFSGIQAWAQPDYASLPREAILEHIDANVHFKYSDASSAVSPNSSAKAPWGQDGLRLFAISPVLPDPQPGQNTSSSSQSRPPGPTPEGETPPPPKPIPALNAQPKRILGVMPNFRAVSAGTHPPPPTPKRAFIIATKNSFDYSSFVFVGITSAFAEWSDAHPQLGEGMAGYGRYYWRGFVDKTDGNYWVIFVLPTILHEDERYYAMGRGGIWKRLAYSSTRVFITPNYHGDNTFNASELFGRGIAQAISTAYYPSKTRTFDAIATKYGYAILRDSATNVFREFWPDIAVHLLHRHP